jgi:hypothetical protein
LKQSIIEDEIFFLSVKSNVNLKRETLIAQGALKASKVPT